MRSLLRTVPNQLTATRLALIPVLWILAFYRLPFYIGIGTIISFITDVLDGFFARKLNQVSDIGSKFDSYVDHLLLPSALIWLWLFVPKVYIENILACVLAIALYFSSMLLGVIKFKRFANLHLYSSKASSVVMYLFVSDSLILERYSHTLFYIAAIMFIVSLTERLALQLLFTEVDEHMGSIFLVWRHRKLS
jgi:cardiolipin synthase (CMP-forming)